MPFLDTDVVQTKQTADIVFTSDEIMAAIERMAAAIHQRLADKNPIILAVMTGGMIPAGWLVPRLNFPLQIDYIHATRYQGATTGGRLQWRVRPRLELRDRHILLVDDILDEGHTLAAIVEDCKNAGAIDVLSAVPFNKLHNRKAMAADFVGLDVPDRYVFGFGMDYKEYWRNLPAVYAVKE